MDIFIQLGIVGIAMGMIYTFMAMGVILLVRAMGSLNFAQGDLFMIGAFITWAYTNQLKLSTPWMLVAAIITFLIGGIIFMFVVYWPLRKSAWKATVIISSLGASLVIREGAGLIWGSYPFSQKYFLPGSIRIGNAVLDAQYFLIIAIGIIVIFGVQMLFDKMYVGRAMQAAAQDKYAAGLCGISTMVTTAATYSISFMLAGLGGLLASPMFFVSLTLGRLQLYAIAGIIIGGFGNIKGAVIGCLLVGLIQSYSVLISSVYQEPIVFLVLLIVLAVRPRGLFGQLISEKA